MPAPLVDLLEAWPASLNGRLLRERNQLTVTNDEHLEVSLHRLLFDELDNFCDDEVSASAMSRQQVTLVSLENVGAASCELNKDLKLA